MSEEYQQNDSNTFSEEDLMKAYVGEYQYYDYQKKWLGEKEGQFFLGWNWAAFFFGILWYSYRKMLAETAIITLIYCIFILTFNIPVAAALLIKSVLLAFLGDWLYFRKTNNMIRIAKNADGNPEIFLKQKGGVSFLGCLLALIIEGLVVIGIYLMIAMVIQY